MSTNLRSSLPVDVDWILEQLACKDHKLPVEAIELARQHRDLLVPRLVECFESAVAAAREGNPPEFGAHSLAFVLLYEFRAREFLSAVLEAVSLPENVQYDLLGDLTGEILPRLFVALAGDQFDVYDALIRNQELSEYVRWDAAQCYCYLVRDGLIPRAEAVARLEQHLREAIENRDMYIAGPLVCELSYLWPVEALETIKEAYRVEVADTGEIAWVQVERAIEAGEEAALADLNLRGPTHLEDALEELKQWGWFRQREFKPRDQEPDQSLLQSPVKTAPNPIRADDAPAQNVQVVSEEPRVGRNDPCPCGSGKKFKKCCLRGQGH